MSKYDEYDNLGYTMVEPKPQIDKALYEKYMTHFCVFCIHIK